MQDTETTLRHTITEILSRDFLLGFFSLFSFLAANHSFNPTLAIYLKRLGSNEREIGVLVGVLAITSVISRLFVGKVLLKYSEKFVMMSGAVLSTLAFIALIVVRPFWPFFGIRVFQGIAFACLDTATAACIINVIPAAHRGQGIGYFMLAPSLAMAMAAPFGMFLVNQYGFTILFLTCACLAICPFFTSWKINDREIVPSDIVTPVNKTFLFEKKIITPALVTFMHSFTWGAIIAFFPIHAVQCGVTNPGIFFSANAVMIITARIFCGRILDAYRKEKIIPMFIFVSMGAMTILAFSKTLTLFIFVGLLWGIGGAFLYPASMAYALEYAGSSTGTAVGTYQAFMDLGMALGPMTMGLIVPLTGYPVMFLCLAFVCLINLVYFQFCVRKRHHITSIV